MYVKAVHFEFEIEFPRRFLHMGRRGPTDGETGRSEEEDESVPLAAKVAALSGRRKRALCVADSSDDEPSQGT